MFAGTVARMDGILHSHFLSNGADDFSVDRDGRALDGRCVGIHTVSLVDIEGLKCVKIHGVGRGGPASAEEFGIIDLQISGRESAA